MKEFFGQYLAMFFQHVVYRQRKIHQRTVIIFAPLGAEKIVKVEVGNDQGVSSKLWFQQLLRSLDGRVGICKIIDFPVKVDALDNCRLKPALNIATHEIPNEVSHQDLRIIKGQVSMGKK